ncbi:transporter substrate-binding domain-containing protein [Paraglaciecola aquimarina]|uniref:Transporter substrate-binding domain-containing protein n=1 Tax=Paraglaciecola aquimarina TaxID=1235557 RepID=A0ABU3SXI9_9ALTE|nr:transporter substrate-binding domain-containing protein [Paraglaciecola aquimarina]MDU0354734.1 transporter substrate-binding domain-containing protein [Paraglaciecola aquimarina]
MTSSLHCYLSLSMLLLSGVMFRPAYANDKQIQVVTELSPPYQTLVNNEVAGSATDIVRDILSAADISASYSMYPWARTYQMAISHPNTLIYSIAMTAERRDLFHWLIPVAHYNFGLVALTERHDLQITSLEKIADYALAVQRGDVSHQWAITQGLKEGEHLIVCPDIHCSWQLLINKKVDFIIESPVLIEEMLERLKQPLGIAKHIIAIPDLSMAGYLAANKAIDKTILDKIKLAIKNTAHQ